MPSRSGLDVAAELRRRGSATRGLIVMTFARSGYELHLADGTVRNHLSSAIPKLQARNRVEAAQLAHDRGWL